MSSESISASEAAAAQEFPDRVGRPRLRKTAAFPDETYLLRYRPIVPRWRESQDRKIPLPTPGRRNRPQPLLES